MILKAKFGAKIVTSFWRRKMSKLEKFKSQKNEFFIAAKIQGNFFKT